MSLLLPAVLPALLLAATVEVPAGGELGAALGLPADATLRYGLNGAPAGAFGRLPRAPDSAGEHHLVVYAEDGRPLRWLRFVVPGAAPGAAPLTLGLDRQPPRITVRAERAIERAGRLYAGAGTTLLAEADDPSGVEGVPQLSLDGQPVADPARPPWPAADQPVEVLARARDRLGNAGASPPLILHIDRSAPTLAARRAASRDGVPEDVVAPGEPIVLQLADAGSGLGSLSLGGSGLPLGGDVAEQIELAMPADPRYRLADRLDNLSEGRLPLRLDTDPPQLLLVSDGVPQTASDGARLPRSERLELRAEDALAGVARACAELSIWYGECRPLPLTVVGIDPGRYRLVFRASDRLGHKTRQRFEIEVLP